MGKDVLYKKAKIIGLKLGFVKPELTEEQEERYKAFTEEPIKTVLSFPDNKKDFLISELEKEVSWDRAMNKREVCNEKGHKYNKKSEIFASGIGGTNVRGYCSRCGMPYKRGMSQEDGEKYRDAMTRPFNI